MSESGDYTNSTSDSESDLSEIEAKRKRPNKEWISLSEEDMDTDYVGNHAVWDRITKTTVNLNQGRLHKSYRADPAHFKLKFRDAFLESSKEWLLELDNFIRNDAYWDAIMDARAQSTEDDSDDEALLAAIDKRKYKIFKTINWDIVDSLMESDTEGEEEDSTMDHDGDDESQEEEDSHEDDSNKEESSSD